jgi:DNA polymerase III epsilon subunit-like protein
MQQPKNPRFKDSSDDQIRVDLILVRSHRWYTILELGVVIKDRTFDNYIVVDFETTGLAPGYRPVEIAWLEFDRDFCEINSVESLINPQMPIEHGAEKVHGISDAMVKDAPTLDDFITVQHSDKFRTSNVLVVAHNAKFDLPMFAPFCGQTTKLCTMNLGRKIYPAAPSFKLAVLAKICGVHKVPTHRALDDVETCFALLKHFSQSKSLSINELIELEQAVDPDAVMPFGKHKGTKIADLPKDYAVWLIDTLDKDDWVARQLRNTPDLYI